MHLVYWVSKSVCLILICLEYQILFDSKLSEHQTNLFRSRQPLTTLINDIYRKVYCNWYLRSFKYISYTLYVETNNWDWEVSTFEIQSTSIEMSIVVSILSAPTAGIFLIYSLAIHVAKQTRYNRISFTLL